MLFAFFEGHTCGIPAGFDVVFWKETLQRIWNERYAFGMEEHTRHAFRRDSEQVFLKMQSGSIRPGDFVGSVCREGKRINIYPKIFYSEKNVGSASTEEFATYVFSHILWWMGYAQDNFRLPKVETDSGESGGDLLEILIYFFAYYTEELLERFAYNDFELVQDEAPVIRGRILMPGWIRNISRQNWQRIPCEYSEFQHDNLLNRIIRYVSGVLISLTRSSRTRRLLEDILNHLDGVGDQEVTGSDCDRVSLNPLFEEYRIVLDTCRMFLDNLIVDHNDSSHSTFSFLVRMDWLYQQFLMGFMKENKLQAGIYDVSGAAGHLAVNRTTGTPGFNIAIDYLITRTDKSRVIGDAKYKRIGGNPEEDGDESGNHGISEADLYQMIAYSYRKGIGEILLLYPKYDAAGNGAVCYDFDLLDAHDRPVSLLRAATLQISLCDPGSFISAQNESRFRHLGDGLAARLSELLSNGRHGSIA
jgi:5-methylcytosine-specific restriction enzyme subunit McrC